MQSATQTTSLEPGAPGFAANRLAARRILIAFLYGIGMGLTFDEFGMWLHLGGSYWQRASWDAVAVIAAGLGLFAYGPALTKYRPRHWVTATLLLARVITFFYLLARSLQHAERIMLPKLERIEQQGPR